MYFRGKNQKLFRIQIDFVNLQGKLCSPKERKRLLVRVIGRGGGGGWKSSVLKPSSTVWKLKVREIPNGTFWKGPAAAWASVRLY